MSRFTCCVVLCLSVVACGDDDSSTADASTDGADPCAACDDGVFCNGIERCEDGVCTAPTTPCGLGTTCDELADRCVTECAVTLDADGDGADSVDCGGTDCDDSNPNRFPGNAEVCDRGSVDEDCDPTTFGERDADGDGYIDALCCNGTNCGDDCDDSRNAVHPDEAESCNELDDDCDGATDEGVLATFSIDADRDGHGSDAADAETTQACRAPVGYAEVADDCDDALASVHPGAYDRCDEAMVDDDCSGTANDPPGGCACENAAVRSCPQPGLCGRSTQTCVAGMWAECAVLPGPEICGNGEDEDCDGAADNGCECDDEVRFCGTDVGECSRGVQTCAGDGVWGPCTGADEAAPETCNELDDDCDGAVDEGVFFRCFEDTDGDGYTVVTATVMEVCADACPVGYTDIDPTPPANRDCDADDPRAYPGQTASFGTPRTSGSFDFDCDGIETATDTVIGSCVEDSRGACFEPREGFVSRRACGTRVTYIVCDTISDSSGNRCEQVYSCAAGSTACGDQNQVKCR